MISEIQFQALDKSEEFSYAAQLEFFKANASIKFHPGLNILFGPNGCGKSSILRMAALALAAEQGGVSTITNTWLGEVTDMFKGTPKLAGIKVLHDGAPILYGNPRNAVGLYGGGAAFDDDFFDEGLDNLHSKDSTGYQTINRLGRMLATLQGKVPFPEKIDDRISLMKPSKSDSARCAIAREILTAAIPIGPKTLIFDEPESGLGIPVQRNVFDDIYAAAVASGFQVIVATHSPFALGLIGANYIEMKPGYLGHSTAALEGLQLRLKMMKRLSELERKLSSKTDDLASNAGADKTVS